MSYQNISAVVTDAQKTLILDAIGVIKTNLPFLVNLTIEDRKRLRKRGPRRVSYVNDVATAFRNHPEAAPGTFNVSEFLKDTALLVQLEDIVSALLPVFEGVDDTLMAVGSEAMKEADEGYGYLKVVAKKSSNAALTTVVKNISDQLKRKPGNPPPPKS